MLHPRTLSFAVAIQMASVPLLAQSTQPAVDRPASAAAAARPEVPTVGTGPDGATLRCRDGSYPAPKAPESACAEKGGVLVRFPLRHVPPTAASVAETRIAPRVEAHATEPDTAVPAGFIPFAVRRSARDTLTGPPAGATLLCKDGTYVVRDTSAARCQARGGLKLRFETRRPQNSPN